jgi:hypothetical protein
MPKRKVTQTTLCKEIKKRQKLSVQRNQLLAINWRDICDMSVTSILHGDMLETSGLRGTHEKEG